MANVMYNAGKVAIASAAVNLASDTIKVMLVTSTYTPDVDTHAFRSSVTNEVSGTGYSAGGATVSGKAVTQDNTNNRAKFTCSAVTWGTSTITARGAVWYKSTGDAATDQLLWYQDFTTDRSSVGADFTITAHADGHFYF